MRALTIKQPWAWAIIMGHKDVENRKSWTNVRETILVHAAKQFDPLGFQFLWEVGLISKLPKDLPRGAILGTVTIADCIKGYESEWAIRGSWNWVLQKPTEFRSPIECTGAQGFFTPDVSPRTLAQANRYAIRHRQR